MKLYGRNWRKTCLSILLVVVCFVTSLLFFSVTSEAEDSAIAVVRFQRGGDSYISYKEVDSGRDGYFHPDYAGDGAYIRTESNGSVICKLAGVVMRVPAKYVKAIENFAASTIVSYYSVSDNGYLLHNYTYPSGSSYALRSVRVGYQPSYLAKGTRYYSYDGHYFYTDFSVMIADYRNNTYNNAVNKSAPHYNYYQYLSMHTTASFTAEQYNAHVAAQNKPTSVMLSTGDDFVATQNRYTVNALLMFGIAVNESGWGTNKYSKAPYNNLFSINAIDSNPDNAYEFPSVEACISEFAYEWVQKDYLHGMDFRYRGPHIGDKRSGMNVKYASDPYWGEKAAERGYYMDTNKTDYGRYGIGIALSGMINFYKEPDVTSTIVYTSDASDGTYIYDSPVSILDKVTGSGGRLFYKVVSDMPLKEDRTAKNLSAIYNADRDYVYVSATDILVVQDKNGSGSGSGGGSTPTPDAPAPEKTHQEVLAALGVSNADNYLTGFEVGNDVAATLATVRALDSRIQVVAKKADGSQITSGTVATGMKLTITTSGNAVDYCIVVRGDVNGDGKLSALDYVKVRNYLDGKNTLTDAYLKGADASSDGNVSALDYVKLRNHLDGKSVIVQ